ncbi:MAG: hypothetical protein ACI9WU_003740 [Myxococcota bacterium]|jgi:hypothetical protein
MLAVTTGACSSDDTGGTTDGDGATTSGATGDSTTDGAGDTGTDEAGTTDGTDTVVATCEVTTTGAVESDGGTIVYQNNGLSVTAEHLEGDSCVNRMDLVYSIDGGCQLTLNFETQQGVWMLANGQFSGDTKCGEFWEGDPVTFELIVDQSVAALNNVGAVVVDGDTSCATSTEGTIIGKAAFIAKAPNVEDDKYFNLNLNGLGFAGGVTTTAVAGGACPVEARTCQGIACGEDFFGASCGGCSEEGFSCVGGSCVEGGCNPDSKETTLGERIGDAIWNTTWSGTPYQLHEECGVASAVWIIHTATW